MPSDAELERDVRETLRGANMDEMSLKLIRKQLEAKWQVNSKYQQERDKLALFSWSRDCYTSLSYTTLRSLIIARQYAGRAQAQPQSTNNR